MRRILLCLLFCLGLIPGYATTSSYAKSGLSLPNSCDLHGTLPTEPDRWIAVWNFDTTMGCILYTGTPDKPGETPPIINYRFIRCQQIGDMFLHSGAAFFNGSGYLSCDFRIGNNDDPAQTYPDFWVFAQANFNPTATVHPLVYHKDFAVNANQGTSLMTSLEWKFRRADHTFSQSSSRLFMPTNDNALRVETCQANTTYCQSNPAWTNRSIINGVSSYVGGSTQPVLIGESPTRLLIGYNPETHTYLNGEMGILIVDPAYGKDPTTDTLPPPPQ